MEKVWDVADSGTWLPAIDIYPGMCVDQQAYIKMRKYPELFDTSAGWLDEWFDPKLLAALAQNTPAHYRTFFKVSISTADRARDIICYIKQASLG